MGKFDFMGFGYDSGHDDMFVAHAEKYTADEAVEHCKLEYAHLFCEADTYRLPWQKRLREPTIDDVQDVGCAFRLGVSSEWPEGCYTLVGIGEVGSFPVHVIDFARLKIPEENLTT